MMRGCSGGAVFLVAAGFVGLGQAAATGARLLPAGQQGEPQSVRDPFRASGAGPAAPRLPGLAGIGVTEAVVRGVVRLRTRPRPEAGPGSPGWAILESPTGEGFVAAPGARLLDGVVGRIDADGVVFWLAGDPDRPVHRPLAQPAAPEEE